VEGGGERGRRGDDFKWLVYLQNFTILGWVNILLPIGISFYCNVSESLI